MTDQSLKKDAGKLRLDLLPPEWSEGLAQVLQMGAEKYEDNGWRKRVMERSRVYAAIQRHLLARQRGEKVDEESGLDHYLHAAWGCLALYYYDLHNLQTGGEGWKPTLPS